MVTSPRPLAVITGASTGISTQYAHRYAREGYDLLLVARSGDLLTTIAETLHGRYGAEVRTAVADLTVTSEVHRVAALLSTGLDRLDHLVNCAGVSLSGDFAHADGPALRRMIDLNVSALTELTRAAVVRMRDQRHGTIVNVASTAGFVPIPHLAAYAATKAYVLHLTEAITEENRGSGLRILAVSPGATDTPMNPGAARGKRTPEQVVETTWAALTRRAISVVDGPVNTALVLLTTRLLPSAVRLRLTGRMMRDRS